MKQTKLTVLVGCVVIVGACFLAYSPAMKGDFLWDDSKYVVNNPLLSAPDGLWRIWFSTDVPSQYFPLVYTALRFEFNLWGLNPFYFHLTNISIHVISALLIWLILSRLSIPAGWFAAAVFALHPVNVESVAWITELKNTLMLLFFLLSVLFYMGAVLRSRTRGGAIVFYILSLICYVLSLLSKTTACVLPVVLIIIIWLKRLPLNRRRLLGVVPYFVIGLVMGLLTMYWEYHYQGVDRIDLHLGFLDRLLIAARAIWFYAGKVFWPVNLAFSYPRWDIDPRVPAQYLWLVSCLLAAGGLWLFRNLLGRGVIAGVVFFVVALVPMLSFFQLYTFLYTWVADHYQYIAIIGLIAVAAGGGAKIFYSFGKGGRVLGVIVAGAVLLALGSLTWRQARLYGNSELIWRDTLAKNPDSWLAHNNLGQMCIAQNKLDEAIFHITRSLELAKLAPVAHAHDIAAAHFNLALVYKQQQRYDDAVEQFQQALNINPGDVEARLEMADALESQGLLDEAGAQYEKLLQMGVDARIVHYRFAQILIRQEQLPGAVEQLHKALDSDPANVAALKSLVDIFAGRLDEDFRRTTKAIEYANRAAEQTNRQNPFVLNLLALVYAANGQYDQAIVAAEEGLKLATDAGANDLAESMRRQLVVYGELLEKEVKSEK